MAIGYLIYSCNYHGNGIYLKYVSIVSFDVRCQNGKYLKLSYFSGTLILAILARGLVIVEFNTH